MSRKAMLLLALLLPLACGKPDQDDGTSDEQADEQLEQYKLHVVFAGLIAFADATVDEREVVWALLPDAKYTGKPEQEDLPPCISPDDPLLPERAPAHHPALRFTGAQVELDGKNVDVNSVFLIDEMDLRFDTGVSGPVKKSKDKLSTKEKVKESRDGDLKDYEKLDNVERKFLKEEGDVPAKERFLGARVLIDFGSDLVANSLTCPTGLIRYGFQAPGSLQCPKPQVELAEDVTVTLDTTQPIKIALLPGTEILMVRPAVARGPVTIEVLNVVESSLTVPGPKPCFGGMPHLEAYRWFYRLVTAPGPCEEHYYPCRANPGLGGDRCPLKGFSQ